jgi:ornithine--oxo-acid transaminase
MPVSCFLSSKEVMQWLNPGSHGSTFGGNPLAAAIGKRSLELLEEENLIENSRVLGDFFKNVLNSINSPVIKEVRGRGLWIGVVIDPNYISGKELSKLLLNEGILCKETHETVIRFAPPLVVTKAEIEWAVEVLKTVITRIETNHRS